LLKFQNILARLHLSCCFAHSGILAPPPDWFDHRHHYLNPEKFSGDGFWAASAVNVLRVLPLGGTLLDLCCGDCFYDYHFYRKRAKEITCVDINPETYRYACRLHKSENINYILHNVLEYEPEESYYDVVLIRGAIEHFSQLNQQLIFQKAKKALKTGGWFCGDTPANPKRDEHKMLQAHEYEWADENEMCMELKKVFNHVESYSMTSFDRTILFWRCKKL